MSQQPGSGDASAARRPSPQDRPGPQDGEGRSVDPATRPISVPGEGATQSYPTGAATADGSTPQDPPQRGNPKRTALIVGAVVLAVALVVVGVLLFRNHQQQVAAEQAAQEARLAEEARQAEATAAGQKAQDYWQALSESNAEQALSVATPAQGNNELLSRDVMAESNTRAALTDATVEQTILSEMSPDVGNSATATVRYLLGDEPHTVEVALRKVDDTWQVDPVAAAVDLGLNGPDRVVNGVTVAPGTYNLFPGSYSVTSANPLIGLDQTEFVVTSPSDPVEGWGPTPVLSDEGRAKAIEAGQRLIDECMQVKELTPQSCPFIRWGEAGVSIDMDSLRYTLQNDPFAEAEFRFNPATMTASALVEVTHQIQASATMDGQVGSLVPKSQTNQAGISVKLGSGEPEASFT